MKTAIIVLASLLGLSAVIWSISHIPPMKPISEEEQRNYIYRRCVQDFSGNMKDPSPCNSIIIVPPRQPSGTEL